MKLLFYKKDIKDDGTIETTFRISSVLIGIIALVIVVALLWP
jgi:hypothetical protein